MNSISTWTSISPTGSPLGSTRRRLGRPTRLELGGLEQVREAARDAGGTRWLEDTRQDFRHALRMLAKQPGFHLPIQVIAQFGVQELFVAGRINPAAPADSFFRF